MSAERERSEVEVRKCVDADAGAWDHFLNGCEGATFYHRHGWTRLNRDVLGHESHSVLAESEGDVCGVLPLTRVRSRLFGDMLVSMPFVNYAGPVGATPGICDQLSAVACEIAEDLGCDYVEIRSKSPPHGLTSRTHKVSMSIDLPKDPEELWDAFKSKHRNNLKRSYRNDLRAVDGGLELLDDFFELMQLGWRDLGTPLYRRAYFESILQTFPDDVRIFVVYQHDTPVATSFNGAFGGTFEGMWAAGHPAHRELQANYVLYWETIKYACLKGYHRFHLGRSTKDSGSARYKARWMAKPEQLYWSYHLVNRDEIPELSPDNPKYRLAMKVWRKLPLPVLRVLGPRLARALP